MNRSLFLSGVLTLFVTLTAIFPVGAQVGDDKTLQDIYNEIDERYSKRVEQALKKDMDRFNKMKSELEEIEKVKDNPGKKKGLDNYKKTHKEHFSKALGEAGIDLAKLLTELQSKYPGYTFTIVDDFGILIEKIQSANGSMGGLYDNQDIHLLTYLPAGKKSSGPNSGNDLSRLPYPNNNGNLQDLVFTQNKAVNCTLASGGNVEFGFRTVRAWSTGVVAGGCNSNGDLFNRTLIPSAGFRSIRLNLGGAVECTGYALGVFGTSISSASSTLNLRIVETGQYITTDNNSWVYGSAIAPFLWYSSYNFYKNFSYSFELTPWVGRTVEIRANSYSSAASIMCCGTNSSSKASLTTANLSMMR